MYKEVNVRLPCIAGMVCWIIWLVVPTDVSPMTQKTRRQEHAGRVPGNEADTSTSLEASVSRDEGKNARLGLFLLLQYKNMQQTVLYMAT